MPEPYSTEFLASLRRRYEEDLHEPVASIAAEFGVNERTVTRIAQREGWRMRSRQREVPEHVRLKDAVRNIALDSRLRGNERDKATPEQSSVRPRERGDPAQESLDSRLRGNERDKAAPEQSSVRPRERGDPAQENLDSRLRGNERDEAPPEQSSARPRESGDPGWIPACAGMSGELPPGHDDQISALDRLERLVLNELAIEEAQRAALGAAPRPPAEAAHKARAYATLLQTLQGIERARNGEPAPAGIAHDPADTADDMPRDLDEFRLALARRIEAWAASRTGGGNAGAGGGAEMVDAAR